jgi:hypothetical protein
MKITRDVITDLLPVYLAGEASHDTRALIEEFLIEDPLFAKLIAEQETPLMQNSMNIPKEIEMKTLENTKKLLWKRSLYLGFAIFFTLFIVAFRFGSEGIHWMWSDPPPIAVIITVAGILMWIKYLQTIRALDGTNI